MKGVSVFVIGWLWAYGCFAQLSVFKNINLQEMGSSPGNFVEVNGTVYFTVTHTDGYRLWKTDGTEAGTVQVSDQNINVPPPEYGVLFPPPAYAALFPFNGYLYYYVSNTEQVELWKTDGISQLFVMNTYPRNFFSYQNELYYLDTNQLKKLVNDSGIVVKTIPTSLEFIGQDPIVLNHQFLFYTQTKSPINSLFQFQLWKSDGTESGTSIFKQMDSTGYFPTYFASYEKNRKMSRVEEVVYFFIYKKLSNDVLSTYQCQLWKTNGTADGTTFVTGIPVTSNTSGPFYLSYPTILASIGDRVLFKTFTEVWSSNGSAEGTVFIKDFPVFGLDYSAFTYKDRFYFAANDGVNGNELWQSDGTPANTKLLKDINPDGNSNPFYFQIIKDKLYFLINNPYELWETNGTTEGTKFIQPLAQESSGADLKPSVIQTSSNELIFKYYDPQNGCELWKSDLTLQNAALLKNIRTDDKGSFIVKLIKVGKYWYFTTSDYRGTELWRTDGTPQGTTIVKDINSGKNGITIQEYVGMGGLLYFTFIFQNSPNNKIHLFRTDGTENGTVEIPLNSGSTTTNVNPTSLRATLNRLFFVGYHQSLRGNTIWVSDGTALGTALLTKTSPVLSPINLTVVNHLLFFTSGRLWVSDGTEVGTKIVLSQSSNLILTSPMNLTEFKGKLYCLAFYYLNFNESGYAIIESDGTELGTKIVYKIGDSNYSPAIWLFFLEKTDDKLYFSKDNSVENRAFDLWATDGTTNGTYKVKTISYSPYIDKVKLVAVNRRLYFQRYVFPTIEPTKWWSTDGTEQGTYEIKLANPKAKLDLASAQKFNNKLYLNIYTPELGMELWTSDGTTSGTRVVDEVRAGANSSYVNNLMDFEDKLLFGANDGVNGYELWQYVPNPCDNNRNYTIKSGLWNDPSVWFCGRIPTENDDVIIKSPHTVTVPVGYTAKASMFYTEQAAVLDVPKGAFVLFKPN